MKIFKAKEAGWYQQVSTFSGRLGKLCEQFSWLLTGQISYALSQWMMLTLLAHWTDTTTVGIFALVIAYTAPLFMLANLQIRSLVATDHQRQFNFREYHCARFVTSIIAWVMLLCVILSYQTQPSIMWILVWIGLGKTCELFSELYYGILQQHDHMTTIGKCLVAKALFASGLFALTLLITRSLEWASCGYGLGMLLTLLLNDRSALRGLLVLPDNQIWSHATPHYLNVISMMVKVLPLGVIMFFISTHVSIPRFFLNAHVGTSEMGIFAALSYLPIAGMVFLQPVCQMNLGRYAKLIDKGQWKHLWSIIGKLAILGTIPCLMAMAISCLYGDRILWLMFGPEYTLHTPMLLIFIGQIFFQMITAHIGTANTASREYYQFFLPYFVTTSLMVCFSSMLIPAYGSYGAAWTMLLNSAANLCAQLWIMLKVSQKRQIVIHDSTEQIHQAA